jgi:hypothetical protein
MWAREPREIRPSAANADADKHPTTANAKASFFIIASHSIRDVEPETGKRSSIPANFSLKTQTTARTIWCTTNGRARHRVTFVAEHENPLRLPRQTAKINREQSSKATTILPKPQELSHVPQGM